MSTSRWTSWSLLEESGAAAWEGLRPHDPTPSRALLGTGHAPMLPTPLTPSAWGSESRGGAETGEHVVNCKDTERVCSEW